jgi:putative hydrolase of the HAD superfamily
MDILIDSNTFFVFDLDDTLFKEIEYLKSAYRSIAHKVSASDHADLYEQMFLRYKRKENVFKWLNDEYGIHGVELPWLLKEYREHIPSISMADDTAKFLEQVREHKIPTGLITDGRSITQRNKLRALGMEDYFRDIIISEEFGSEKPDERNYLFFENKYPGKDFYFFGDNTGKDFIVPQKLGWKTVCIKDDGNHIHPQKENPIPAPAFMISSFKEIVLQTS